MQRLRRLMASAETAGSQDRRRLLLAMQSEVQTIRADLIKRSRETADKINAAGAQLGAASAYARCATLRRSVPKAPNKAMD